MNKSLIYKILLSVVGVTSFMAHAESSPSKHVWLDNVHKNVADSMDSTALWFDKFFILEEFSPDQYATGEARIRLGWEPRSRDLAEFDTRFRVKFRLPNLKHRVDVVMSDYEDEQADNSLSVLQDDNNNVNDNRLSLALRFKHKPDSGLSHRLGVGRGLQIFARTRYRNSHSFSEKLSFRWETAANFYSKDGFGSEITGQFGYTASPSKIYRFNNHFVYRDETNDWFWQHNLQYLSQLDNQDAIIAGIYFEGNSRPDYRLEEYLTSVRWRKNALREWLFFEVEPFILWRRDESFSASYGLALRVEGHFSRD